MSIQTSDGLAIVKTLRNGSQTMWSALLYLKWSNDVPDATSEALSRWLRTDEGHVVSRNDTLFLLPRFMAEGFYSKFLMCPRARCWFVTSLWLTGARQLEVNLNGGLARPYGLHLDDQNCLRLYVTEWNHGRILRLDLPWWPCSSMNVRLMLKYLNL